MSSTEPRAAWRPTALPIDPNHVPDVGPASMRVTSPYGWRHDPLGSNRLLFHDGLDIGNAREGDELVADAAGRVVVAGAPGWPWSEPTTRYPSGNFGGTMVVVEHAGPWLSIYAHMRPELAVAVGDRVRTGDTLGTVGATGAAAAGGAHLHYGHVLKGAADVTAAGRVLREWTVDPWPRIDAVGALPEVPEPTREQRLAAEVIELRQRRPRAWHYWRTSTRLDQALDELPLRRVDRLAATALYLRADPLDEG